MYLRFCLSRGPFGILCDLVGVRCIHTWTVGNFPAAQILHRTDRLADAALPGYLSHRYERVPTLTLAHYRRRHLESFHALTRRSKPILVGVGKSSPKSLNYSSSFFTCGFVLALQRLELITTTTIIFTAVTTIIVLL